MRRNIGIYFYSDSMSGFLCMKIFNCLNFQFMSFLGGGGGGGPC